MKMYQSLKYFIGFIVCGLFTSCQNDSKNDNLLLNINFGKSTDISKKQIEKLVKKDELILITRNFEVGDTIKTEYSYKKKINIGSFSADLNVTFNGGKIQSGPLRNYSYAILTPYVKNIKSIEQNKINKNNEPNETSTVETLLIAKKSDIDTIRSYLDKKYGSGIKVEVNTNFLLSEKIMYSSHDLDIILELGQLTMKGEDIKGMNIKADVSHYNYAAIDIRSKKYAELLSKEYSRLKNTLKPQDVFEIKFKQPILDIDDNGFDQGYVIKVEQIIFKADFLKDKVIEFKGELKISDSFDEPLLIENNFLYTFKEPLGAVNIYQLFGLEDPNLNSFYFFTYSKNYAKIKKTISSGRRLKIELKPQAVVLDTGEIIK